MTIFIDLFKGKYGLARTYWLWGCLGGVLVAIGSFIATYIATKNLNNEVLYDVIINGYTVFIVVWVIFISVAIINSSTYKRERGVWGWIACVLSAIAILRAVVAFATMIGIVPMQWRDLEKGIIIENVGLPIVIEEGLILTKMSTDSKDRSLTYHLRYDYKTLNDETFDLKVAKEASLESCADMKRFLEVAVKKIIYHYEANDGTTIQVEILPADCGF